MAPNVDDREIDEGVMDNEGLTVDALSSTDPIKLSQFLSLDVKITSNLVDMFKSKAKSLALKDKKTAKENQWLADFVMNLDQLDVKEVKAESSNQSVNEEMTLPVKNATKLKVDKLKLNELVKRPQLFDGVRPPARQWLDDYEKASESNGWEEETKVSYFATFLDKSANDWFVTVAKRKLGSRPTWENLRAAFLRHYLGDCDRQSLRKQIEETRQYRDEKAASFIPRLLRLVDLLEPNKPEADLVEQIRYKLRQEYQEKLILSNLSTLEALNDACLKIEAASLVKSSIFKSKFQRTDEVKPNSLEKERTHKIKNRFINPKSRPKESTKKCFRCQRNNHLAKDCFATKRLDGQPCQEKKVKDKISVTAIRENGPEDDQSKSNIATVTARIRGVGSNTINTIIANSSATHMWNNLIYQDVICNEVPVKALIDTGATLTVIGSNVVQEQRWKIMKNDIQLIHAAGDNLDCIGKTKVNIEFPIEEKSLSTCCEVLVVNNLCVPMIIGMDLLRAFKVNINVHAKRPLSFQKGIFKKGMRCVENFVIPARHSMLVKVGVQTDANLVGTLPFHIDNSIMIANSVSKVVNNSSFVLMMNLDISDIRFKKGQQIASFFTLEMDNEKKYSHCINAILELEDTSEIVRVGDQLTTRELSELSNVLKRNLDAFSIKGSLGKAELVEHSIELVENAKPFIEKARRHPKIHIDEARNQVKDMLDKDIIEPSISPWCSEFVIVKKKTGEFRLCIDFRKLNAVTKKDAYPLPNVEECLENLGGNCYFSQLDFASGYWQLPVAETSRELTAFRVDGETYQFKRMPFGLTNAPATFQRMINALFGGMRGLNLQVFLDDICIASKTWTEHLNLLEQVFRIVVKAKLKLKSSKCLFGSDKVTFLGHEVSQKGIRPEPDKVKAFAKLPAPTDAAGVRRVMGAFNYYRKFIPKFAILTEPLIKLTRKNVTFKWTSTEEDAFNKIKYELNKSATLAHLNSQDPVILKTDASLIGVAGILLQEQDKEWRLISCVSRHLKSSEKRYPPMELEALAIVYSLHKLRHFLLGRFFTIVTDHSALCVLNRKTPQNARVERWALALSEYNFKIIHQKGSCHEDVDCLSRAPVDTPQDDYLDKILVVRPKWEEINTVQSMPVNPDAWVLNYDDEESQRILQQAENESNTFHLKQGVIFKGNLLYVPKAERIHILKESHSSICAAHDGIEATLYRLKSVWWPNMRNDTETFVKSCEECQRRKVARTSPRGTMYQHESFSPFEVVAFDYIGPLPESLNRKKFIVVAIDHFTRFVDAKSLKDQSAERFAKFFVAYVGRFGPPKFMLTDNAKTFCNKSMDCIRKDMNIKHILSVAGHSQGNAICERVIETINEKLSMVTRDSTQRLDWEMALPSIVLSINSKIHKATKYTPYELMFGRDPPLIQRSIERNVTPHDLHAQVVRSSVEQSTANAVSNTYDAHNRSRCYTSDRELDFAIGDIVLTKVKSRSAKIGPKYEGPYEVTSRNKDIYDIKRVDNPNDIRRRHVSSLKKFITPTMTSSSILTLLILLVGTIGAIPLLKEVQPIRWKEDTDKFVSEGTEDLIYVYHFASPCTAISEYAKLLGGNNLQLTQQLPVNRVPTPVNPGQLTPPIPKNNRKGEVMAIPINPVIVDSEEDDEDQVDPASSNQWLSKEELIRNGLNKPKIKRQAIFDYQVKQARLQCDEIFNRTILSQLDAFHENHVREPRQLGFIAGVVVSNIISEIKSEFGHNKRDEWQRNVQVGINTLHQKHILVSVAMKAMESNMKNLQGQVADLQLDATKLPSLNVFSSFVIAEMENKKSILETFYFNRLIHKSDPVNLAMLFNQEKFNQIEVKDVSVARTKSLDRNTLQIQLFGHIRSKTTKVYEVRHINYYSNFTGAEVRHEYVGKLWLVYNSSCNCAKATDPTSHQQVHTICDEHNYRDPQLKLWRATMVDRRQPKHSQMLVSWPNIIVNCWGNSISFATSKSSVFEETKCPTNTFIISNKYTFNTSDQLVRHIANRANYLTDKAPVIMAVPDVHFKNFKYAHELFDDAIKLTENLLAKQENMSLSNVAVDTGLVRITWEHLVYVVTIVSANGFGVLLILWMCNNCRKRQFPKPSWPWLSPQPMVNVESEVRREVTKQIQIEKDAFNEMLSQQLVSIQTRPRKYSRNVTPIITEIM